MRSFAVTVLTCIILYESLAAIPVQGGNGLAVCVKKGDWAEYDVAITGTPPPIHNVTWLRIEVLQVNDDAFPVNLTVRYRNDTFCSSIWQFNFTSGNTEGWIIIPSNLGVGDTFYDVFNKTGRNITIKSQTQENLLGATRTVTYANDSLRQKEWDKTTGVMVTSYEAFKKWTAMVNITATNLWSPKTAPPFPTNFYLPVVGGAIVAVSAISSAAAIQRRRLKRFRKKPFGSG